MDGLLILINLMQLNNVVMATKKKHVLHFRQNISAKFVGPPRSCLFESISTFTSSYGLAD